MKQVLIGIGTKLRSVDQCYVGALCQVEYQRVSFMDMIGYNRWREGVKVEKLINISYIELVMILGKLNEWEIKINKRYINLKKFLDNR